MKGTKGLGPRAVAVGVVVAAVALVVVVSAGAWLVSIKGTDVGTVCLVREGGPFDGRDIKEIRQPGEGPKPIGAFNKQDCLPITERDSTDVIEEDQTFPTRDSVQVIVDGQALYQLTSDPGKVEKFYRGYGRRKWGGEDISSESGWLNFQRQRLAPVILDAQREVIGGYQCNALNNLCQYVQNPEAAVQRTGKDSGAAGDTTQNLSEAQRLMAAKIREKLRAAFGDEYFENVRYQNLRIRFEAEVQKQITQAQSLRTQAANARLEAERQRAQARGEADRKVEVAEGERRAAFQQARAYRLNPNQAQIDRIRAFCGTDGCDPQVLGGNLDNVISQIAGRSAAPRTP
ncbi:MAG TPA: SPFH domain-containing protein [Solirubrobacteraceae bacterium]|nr:SPFH domain-containing protein [Solirubrobacteraceae bacterium]